MEDWDGLLRSSREAARAKRPSAEVKPSEEPTEVGRGRGRAGGIVRFDQWSVSTDSDLKTGVSNS